MVRIHFFRSKAPILMHNYRNIFEGKNKESIPDYARRNLNNFSVDVL